MVWSEQSDPSEQTVEGPVGMLAGALFEIFLERSVTQRASIEELDVVHIIIGKRLEQEFAVSTIREMAVNKHAEWARAAVLLADVGLAAQAVADSPLAKVREVGGSQARLLKEEFGIETVGDLGTNRFFNVAWAIFMLAESEG